MPIRILGTGFCVCYPGRLPICRPRIDRASTPRGSLHYDSSMPNFLSPSSKTTLLCSLIVACVSGCASLFPTENTQRAAPSDAIAQSVKAALAAGDIPESALGGVVIRARSGEVLWSRQAQKPMQPASTIKVLTSIVALETLTPAYRGSATLVTNAPQRGDVLAGDLALIGRGMDEFHVSQLQAMLRALRAQGVATIDGNVILDREFFQPPRAYEGVAPFDESPEFRYNVIPDALMLGSNLNQLALASDENTLRVVFGPAMEGVEFVSEMTLGDKPCRDWEDDWKIPRVEKNASGTIRVTLLGEFPKRCTANTEINVLSRTDYAERIIRHEWRALGGMWRGVAKEGIAPGGAKDGTAPAGADLRIISKQESRTLAEFNRDINKRSDNAITRTAFLSLAATKSNVEESDKTLSTSARAERIVRAWLTAKNIDHAGLVIENGSGLSRIEMISPMTLAQTLHAAHASKWASEFMMSLPIVGVDGAMRNRLQDTAAKEIGRMKTGGLRNVTSVAGYLPDPKSGDANDSLVVVLFLNHDNARGAKGRAVLDELMKGFMQRVQ